MSYDIIIISGPKQTTVILKPSQPLMHQSLKRGFCRMTPLPTCDYLFLPVKNYETTTFKINMNQHQVLIKHLHWNTGYQKLLPHICSINGKTWLDCGSLPTQLYVHNVVPLLAGTVLWGFSLHCTWISNVWRLTDTSTHTSQQIQHSSIASHLHKLIELDSSIFIKIHFPDHVTDLVSGHILSQSLHQCSNLWCCNVAIPISIKLGERAVVVNTWYIVSPIGFRHNTPC